jgi:hypothetical protein
MRTGLLTDFNPSDSAIRYPGWRSRLKWGDFAVVAATLLLCAILWTNLMIGYGRERSFCEVVVRGDVVLRYDLSTTEKIFENPETESFLSRYDEERISDTELIIHLESGSIHFDLLLRDGKIRFSKSDCPDQVCVYTGFIEKNGQIAACVPAGVLVRVIGNTDPNDPDFIAR